MTLKPVSRALIGLAATALAAGLLAAVLTGCAATQTAGVGSGANGKLRVVTSVNTWGSLVKSIGGSYVSVTAIISDPMQDPHSYTATVRDQLAVNQAQLIVANGAGYDGFINTLGMKGKKGVFSIASNLSNPSFGTNPHIWYSIPADREAALLLAKQLGAIDTAHASYFTQNAARISTQLALLQVRETGLTQGKTIGAVSVESIADLMLNESGVKVLTPTDFATAVQNDTEIPPKALADASALLTQHKAQLLVTNAQVESAASKALTKAATAAGVPVVAMSELLPKGKDLVQWMTKNFTDIQVALQSSGAIKPAATQ